jgi:lipopolysaccharide export system permease protein
VYQAQPGQFRAEFHDRMMAPLYPIAFAVVAYAFLGAPRTTRQSRAWSMLAVIGWVGGIRLVGFVSTVFGVNVPAMLAAQYLVAFGAIAFGLFAISRGLIIEPPAYVLNAVNAVIERVAKRAAALTGPAQ